MEGIAGLLTIDFVRSGIRLATPIVLAATGGALCNKAGVLNLALEGKMLLGAFVGILSAFFLHSSWLGLLAAMCAGGLLGALFAFLYLRYDVNLVILAIAINMFIAEMTVFTMRVSFGDVGTWSDPSIKQLPDISVPLVRDVPGLNVLSGHNAIVYLSWAAAIGIYLLLFRTRFGRHLRAVGENKDAAESAGINVDRVRVFALVASGMLAAAGGAFLSIGHLTLFTREMSNGRGWVAVAAALFGFNHPIAVLFTGTFFGFADAFTVRLQTTTRIPPILVQFLPQLLTLLALVIVAARSPTAQALARRAFKTWARRGMGAGAGPEGKKGVE